MQLGNVSRLEFVALQAALTIPFVSQAPGSSNRSDVNHEVSVVVSRRGVQRAASLQKLDSMLNCVQFRTKFQEKSSYIQGVIRFSHLDSPHSLRAVLVAHAHTNGVHLVQCPPAG